MALSDLAVFNEYAYAAMIETIDYQINLFNEATRGALVLRSGDAQGDYQEAAFFKRLIGAVRRRNAYGSGAVSPISLQQAVDRSVKVAAGTPPIQLDPGQFDWIKMNPETAGAAAGQTVAQDMLADMVNTGLGIANAALRQHAELFLDHSTDKMQFQYLADAAIKFGDRASEIVVWAMHSIPMYNLHTQALTNGAQLFTYGSVNVVRDPMGRVFIISDSPALYTLDTAPNPDTLTYHTLGLTTGAVTVAQNSDYRTVMEEKTGDENLQAFMQSQWSYNASVKGFAWDKTNGGHSPTDAALLTSTNWDKIVTSFKDTAGVVIDTDNL